MLKGVESKDFMRGAIKIVQEQVTSHVAARVNSVVKAALAIEGKAMDVMEDLDHDMPLYISHAWMECFIWSLGLNDQFPEPGWANPQNYYDTFEYGSVDEMNAYMGAFSGMKSLKNVDPTKSNVLSTMMQKLKAHKKEAQKETPTKPEAQTEAQKETPTKPSEDSQSLEHQNSAEDTAALTRTASTDDGATDSGAIDSGAIDSGAIDGISQNRRCGAPSQYAQTKGSILEHAGNGAQCVAKKQATPE